MRGATGKKPARGAGHDEELSQETDKLLPISPQGKSRQGDFSATLKVGLATGFSYALSYFWRYPIFILPKEVLETPVLTVHGKSLDLQASFSMAFILGFGAAKMPLASFVSSDTFFRHRFAVIAFMFVGSMVVELSLIHI